jgi:hypothetical protein
MKSIIAVTLSVFAVTLLMGCGGSGEKVIKKIEAVEKKACACKDKACASEAMDEFKKVFNEVKNEKVTAEQTKKLQESAKNIVVCLIKQKIEPQNIQEMIRAQ